MGSDLTPSRQNSPPPARSPAQLAALRELAIALVAADPVGRAVALLVRSGPFEGTAAELLEALDEARTGRRPRGWPRTPRELSGRLRRVAAALRLVGVDVDHHRQPGGSRRRLVSINLSPGSRRHV